MSKRTNGEGTIFQKPNGSWKAEITVGYDEANKRIVKTKSDPDIEVVKKWLAEERTRFYRGVIVKNNDYSLREWVLF